MKQMTCAQMGGPAECTTVISGSKAEEMVTNGYEHIKAEHHELAAQIAANTKEVNDAWMEEFRKKFEALPEAPSV